MEAVFSRTFAKTALLGFVFFAVTTPLLAEVNPLFVGATEYRGRASEMRALVPKYWLIEPKTYTTLQGVKVDQFLIYPRSDKGSRLSYGVSFVASTPQGIFRLPDRLRGKLTDADFVNWHIDLLRRSENGFTLLSVRRETALNLPALAVEYSVKTPDRYIQHTTDYFVFKGERVYRVSVDFIAGQKDKKPLLEAVLREIRFLTTDELRVAK